MARQQQRTEAVRATHLQAVDRDVLHPGARVAGDQQAGGDVGATVVLVMSGDRQLFVQVDLTVHHLLAWRIGDFIPGQRIEAGLFETCQHLAGLDPHRLGHPLTVGEQTGYHGDRMATRLGEQRGAFSVQTIGNRRNAETQVHAGVDHCQALVPLQMVEPAAQTTACWQGSAGSWCGSGHRLHGRTSLLLFWRLVVLQGDMSVKGCRPWAGCALSAPAVARSRPGAEAEPLGQAGVQQR
ncbi:hypothetical protein D3C85_1177100 [compost metagenome]